MESARVESRGPNHNPCWRFTSAKDGGSSVSDAVMCHIGTYDAREAPVGTTCPQQHNELRVRARFDRNRSASLSAKGRSLPGNMQLQEQGGPSADVQRRGSEVSRRLRWRSADVLSAVSHTNFATAGRGLIRTEGNRMRAPKARGNTQGPKPERRDASETLDGVAQRAKVSRPTASRAPNALTNVGDESRVGAPAGWKALGSTIDLPGRALGTGRNRNLGPLLCDLCALEEPAVTRAALDGAALADLRVFLSKSRGYAGRRRDAVAKRRVDGVEAVVLLPDQAAALPAEWERKPADYVAQRGQIVYADPHNQKCLHEKLRLDEFDAAPDLGEVLTCAGHRRFAVVADNDQDLRGDDANDTQSGVRQTGHDDVVFSSIFLGDVNRAGTCAPCEAATTMDVAAARTLKLVTNRGPLRVTGTPSVAETTRAVHPIQFPGRPRARMTQRVSGTA